MMIDQSTFPETLQGVQREEIPRLYRVRWCYGYYHCNQGRSKIFVRSDESTRGKLTHKIIPNIIVYFICSQSMNKDSRLVLSSTSNKKMRRFVNRQSLLYQAYFCLFKSASRLVHHFKFSSDNRLDAPDFLEWSGCVFCLFQVSHIFASR